MKLTQKACDRKPDVVPWVGGLGKLGEGAPCVSCVGRRSGLSMMGGQKEAGR